MLKYKPTGPSWFAHQKKHFEEHRDDIAWGLLWEMGTAKTKPIIDTMSWLFLNDKIDAMVVVAPPGVERNWLSDELPVHCPMEVKKRADVMVWNSSKAGTKTHARDFEYTLKHEGLSIFLISYPAFVTPRAKKAMWRFLKKRRTLFVLDESHNIKTAKAKRTQSIVAAGKYGMYRRILTGTPVSHGPFDVYPQIRFLDQYFWKDRDINTFAEFKQRYGEWDLRSDVMREEGYDPGYDRLLGYKNLEELNAYVYTICDRVVKDEVLDLPPKLYTKRYFDMDSVQTHLYNELRDEYITELRGEVVSAELALVRLLRLQQITCGYIKTDDEEPVQLISNKNPRLECLASVCEQTIGQGLIWARFRKDVDQIMELLGDTAVRYDGSVSQDQAEINKSIFQLGHARWFVGTAAKGGSGLTLHMAKTVIYYNNSFKLIDRLQSEDRAHRSGMDKHPVNYIDICCPDTVDMKIVSNLVGKVDIASQITGDTLKEWL